MSSRRRAPPAISSSLMPAEAADSVNDPRAALHEDLRPDPPTTGDGLGRAARMGGEAPARYLQSADPHRGCPQFPDDRLPVPAAAVLPGDRWRRRLDPGRGRGRPRLPADL